MKTRKMTLFYNILYERNMTPKKDPQKIWNTIPNQEGIFWELMNKFMNKLWIRYLHSMADFSLL